MNITIMRATENPIEVISLAAGTCYGKSDVSEKRVRNCIKAGHTSVLEHVSVTFRVEGISRACSHQLVRHRMASYCQESQRYCRYDFRYDDWFVTPPDIADAAYFKNNMQMAALAYIGALREGVRPEDARYMLPEATKTALVVTMNGRELFHFLNLRGDKAAQWEIREMAEYLEVKLKNLPRLERTDSGEWATLMNMREAHRD